MRPMIALALALLASGCAAQHELATCCAGPLVPLNPSHWQPTPEELTAMAKATEPPR